MGGLLGFDLNDPSYALLGLGAGLGQGAMPSRMPVPLGAALGQGAAGMAQGSMTGAQAKLLGQEAQKNQLGNLMQMAQLRLRAAYLAGKSPEDSLREAYGGMATPSQSSGGLLSGLFGGNSGAPSGAASSNGMGSAGTAPATSGFLGGPGAGAPPSAAPSPTAAPPGGNSGPMSPGAQTNNAGASGNAGSLFGRDEINQILFDQGLGVPNDVISKRITAPTDIANLERERAAIAATNPQDPRVAAYDAAIAKASGAPTGYLLNPQGGFSADQGYVKGQGAIAGSEANAKVPADLMGKGFALGPNGIQAVGGGPADPRYLGAVKGAESWGSAPAEAWVASMAPKTLRGPGSVEIDPYHGTSVQVPNELDYIDPQTLAKRKAFVPLGLSVTGSGPMADALRGAPGPSGSGSPGGGNFAVPQVGAAFAQPGAVGPAAQTGGAATGAALGATGAGAPATPGSAGETNFMTGAPPAREAAEQKLGEEFGDRDKKAYDASNQSLASLYQMNAAADQMAKNGGWATPGAGNAMRGEFTKAVNSWEQSFGFKPSADPNTVASWELMGKETKRAGMQLVNQMFGGGREAASIINGATSAVPSGENTYTGYRVISSSIEQALQRERDLYEFKSRALTNNQSLSGAEADFNKANPPGAYTKRAIANAVPDGAVQMLSSDPMKFKGEFDRKYGSGMSDFILGGGRTGIGTAGGFQ